MEDVKAIIEIKDIARTYHVGQVNVPALKGVTLTLNRGEFLIITGRNGSGKSTLLHQLGLLDYPDKGTIRLNGQEVTSLAESKRAELRLNTLGYVFQEYALIGELTALENIMLPALAKVGKSACRHKALELLIQVGLKGKENRLPSQLSGGEQQKVAIARALVNDPEVIFADEPTANLDIRAAEDVLEIFKVLNNTGHTIVMITHEPEEVAYGNRVIELVDGRLK
ncbi:MAG: ABC transporter ATP-binding protein [Patescibacteria group bacterium]|jgi:putative ABC transport system ATP-binding protein